jgi:hypothetical protein
LTAEKTTHAMIAFARAPRQDAGLSFMEQRLLLSVHLNKEQAMTHKDTEKEARRVVEGGEADQQSRQPGDNRTPDKTIGQVKYAQVKHAQVKYAQVKYADNEGGGEQKQQAGSTRTTTPEKQGGVGGP